MKVTGRIGGFRVRTPERRRGAKPAEKMRTHKSLFSMLRKTGSKGGIDYLKGFSAKRGKNKKKKSVVRKREKRTG